MTLKICIKLFQHQAEDTITIKTKRRMTDTVQFAHQKSLSNTFSLLLLCLLGGHRCFCVSRRWSTFILQWKGDSQGDTDQQAGRGVFPAVVLMVCVSGADGVVSSLGHQPSLSLSPPYIISDAHPNTPKLYL